MGGKMASGVRLARFLRLEGVQADYSLCPSGWHGARFCLPAACFPELKPHLWHPRSGSSSGGTEGGSSGPPLLGPEPLSLGTLVRGLHSTLQASLGSPTPTRQLHFLLG